ncbi:MAG: cyclic nucleotide-binding domain-containing protein [Spirochaetaceae bacterium]|jgi:CRP-like cAMP-binding protein|nr:cyclic nucleotide-binding domain-containing protein [Spirochaetaceae bacterium]
MSGKLELSFVNFPKGAYITLEGKQDADRFFIIHQGKVRLSKEVEVVAEEGRDILGPGDFFAVVSTMSSHSHIETAQAVTDVTLISVKKEQYSQLIQNNTPVAMKIILQFSKRMRYLDESLTRLTLKNTAENDLSHLFDVGTYYNKQSQFDQAYYAYHQYVKYCPAGKNVNQAREQMMKIALYAKNTKFFHGSDEFNREYPKGSMLFSEGEPGDELYIIQKGSVKITKIVDNNEVLLAVLKTGDIFGEMALLESKPRSASAVAFEDCTVLVVTRTNFVQMVGTQPQIIARLTTLLSERLWFIYKQLANTQIDNPMGRMYDALLIQLEKNRIILNSDQPYTFDFGPLELFNMVGLSRNDGMSAFLKMTETGKIQVLQDKIMVMSVLEILRQTVFFKKLQKIR